MVIFIKYPFINISLAYSPAACTQSHSMWLTAGQTHTGGRGRGGSHIDANHVRNVISGYVKCFHGKTTQGDERAGISRMITSMKSTPGNGPFKQSMVRLYRSFMLNILYKYGIDMEE